jgi:hypothetical protein
MKSSTYCEPKCEKVWKAGRELERAVEAIQRVRYHLERIIQNEYAPEPILQQAKAYLESLDGVADLSSSEIWKAVDTGVKELAAGESDKQV